MPAAAARGLTVGPEEVENVAEDDADSPGVATVGIRQQLSLLQLPGNKALGV